MSLTIPPIHRFVPLVFGQVFRRQMLGRVPEPEAVTDQADNVLQYDQVMTTKLAVAYAVGLEIIYRARTNPFGGKAIDLACGPGHFSLCLAKYLRLDQLDGVDLSMPMVLAAQTNSQNQGVRHVHFRLGDVTQLAEIPDKTYDLCTFCDAAHHMPDLETVHKVLTEMERIAKSDGLVFVMDLARLKSKKLTDAYVNLLGRDYNERGLSAFYTDFKNSMYAAWTGAELTSALPADSERTWFHLVPRGLPTIQLCLGVPASQQAPCQRRGLPWANATHPLAKHQRSDWRLMRYSLQLGRTTKKPKLDRQ